MTQEKIPTEIILHKKSRSLEVHFNSGECFILPCAYLRVFSPSAEERGHGSFKERKKTGKENVNILSIEAVGHYAIKPIFSDGHQSGIYSWQTLYELGVKQKENWSEKD